MTVIHTAIRCRWQFAGSAAFPRPTYLTNVCHWWVFATWHERSATSSRSHCSVCHRLSVNGKRHTGHRNHHWSFNYQGKTCVCFPTTRLHLDSSDFECRVSNIQYVVWGVLQHTNCGNTITMTRQTFDKCTRLQMFAEHTSRGITILTYLLTPWSGVLLEKLTGSAASQEIPRIFGTRMFITVLTSARHLSLSWAKSIQSSQPPPSPLPENPSGITIIIIIIIITIYWF